MSTSNQSPTKTKENSTVSPKKTKKAHDRDEDNAEDVENEVKGTEGLNNKRAKTDE